MKKLAILILIALGALLACGHSNLAPPNETETTGNWEAQLLGGKGEASLLNFVIGFNVHNTNGGTTEPLTITSFGFINLGQCFVTQSPAGSADLTTNDENQVTGSMSLTITSRSPLGNTLTLTSTNGVTGTATGTTYTTMTNGVVTGTWSLTGGQGDAGCTGGGTFTMCQNAATCTVP
jgi:hypothetical protein